jgi:hypothetical protein
MHGLVANIALDKDLARRKAQDLVGLQQQWTEAGSIVRYRQDEHRCQSTCCCEKAASEFAVGSWLGTSPLPTKPRFDSAALLSCHAK